MLEITLMFFCGDINDLRHHFENVTQELNLTQVVSFPTRGVNTLHVIYTNRPNLHDEPQSLPPLGRSDHFAVLWPTKVSPSSDNSESDGDSENENDSYVNANFVSSSGIVWTTIMPSNRGRRASHNVINFRPGPAIGINPSTEKEAVLIFLQEVLEETHIYTNLEGRRQVNIKNSKNPANVKIWKKVDMDEIEAFIGLLIVIGAFLTRYRYVAEL
jgi:hypothetical protein